MTISRVRSHLAVAGNPYVLIFDVAGKSTSEISTLDGHRGNVTALGYDNNAQWLFTASEDATMRIWDTRREPMSAFDTRTSSAIYAAQVHPAQVSVIAGDQDGKVYTWDLRMASGKGSSPDCLQSVKLESGMSVRALSVSSDGKRVAVATNNGRVIVYSCDSAGGKLSEIANWSAHSTYILQTAFSPDGSILATASADHTVKLWSCAPTSTGAPTAAAASSPAPSSPTAAGAPTAAAAPVPAAGEKEKEGYSLWRTLVGHQRWVWDCAFNSDGEYLLTGSSDHTARLWRVSTGEAERQFIGHQKAISCIALNDAV